MNKTFLSKHVIMICFMGLPVFYQGFVQIHIKCFLRYLLLAKGSCPEKGSFDVSCAGNGSEEKLVVPLFLNGSDVTVEVAEDEAKGSEPANGSADEVVVVGAELANGSDPPNGSLPSKGSEAVEEIMV